MYIKIKLSYLIMGAGLLISLWWGGVALAGDPDSSGDPASTNAYTLEDLYQRLNSGAAGSQSPFTEPSSGPGTGTMHTLDQIMAVAPAADDPNGATAADVASGKTFWGLTTSGWGQRTGTANPAPVPETGQTTSHATGDDGDAQMGAAWPTPRFTENGNGTVTDNLTGLIWLKNANCTDTVGGIDKSGGNLNWADALTWSNNLANGDCGLSDGSSAGDWRLPNVRELGSLIDYGKFNFALPSDHPFSGIQQSYYWSSSTVASTMTAAWFVYLYDGGMLGAKKVDQLYVLPVRGGQ